MLTYKEFESAVEYVFESKISYVCSEKYDIGDINRSFVLGYIKGVMFELSDTNDHQYWRILKVNDDSLNGYYEVPKYEKYLEAIAMLAEFKNIHTGRFSSN
jgi:hypothetical protein